MVVMAGAACWVVNRSGIGRQALLVTSLQALVGGSLQLILGLATGELSHVVPHTVVAALPAFIYLVLGPSLIGFPVLTWLVSRRPVHIANSASYAAPVIALALGWLLLGTPVTPRAMEGVGVILIGVVVIVLSTRRTHPAAEIRAQCSCETQTLAA